MNHRNIVMALHGLMDHIDPAVVQQTQLPLAAATLERFRHGGGNDSADEGTVSASILFSLMDLNHVRRAHCTGELLTVPRAWPFTLAAAGTGRSAGR